MILVSSMMLPNKIENFIKNWAKLGRITPELWNHVASIYIMLLLTHINFFVCKQCFQEVVNIYLNKKCRSFILETQSSTENNQFQSIPQFIIINNIFRKCMLHFTNWPYPACYCCRFQFIKKMKSKKMKYSSTMIQCSSNFKFILFTFSS